MMTEGLSRWVRLCGVACSLALAVTAGALIIDHPNALAREAKAAAQRGNAPAGNTQNGEKVFTSEKCAGCHGPQGEGGTGQIAAPRIGPPRFGLPMFLDAVRNAKAPMPSFSASEVSDAALADVFAFLSSKTAPPQAATPAGNAANGKTAFMKVGCFECHDTQGQGGQGTGPRLAPNPIPYAAFSRQCRQPVNEMPPYTSKIVSDAELADIYAYLQSIPVPPPASSIPLLP
jgi:mono/diheme cytochrome c family protein